MGHCNISTTPAASPPAPASVTKKRGEGKYSFTSLNQQGFQHHTPFLTGQFLMWFSNKNYPVFSAVEPNVNPLPACLDKTRPEKYMSQFLPGNYSESIKNPGYLTLPGEILFKINNYKTIAL